MAGTRSTYQITTCTHRTNCAKGMALGHLSILLTHYGAFYMHVYRGLACSGYKITTNTDNYAQQREHVPGPCSSGKFLFRSHEEGCSRRLYRRRAAGKNIKLHTYIRNHYMSRELEAAVKSCFIHTSGNEAGTFIRSSQPAHTKRIYEHTLATAVIACPRDMYPQRDA